jgi:diguanylate cyclase (GGDEF)-like protein
MSAKPTAPRYVLADNLKQVPSERTPPARDFLLIGQRSEQYYQLLLETAFELASTLDLGEVLHLAAQRLNAILQIPDCDIYRLEGVERLVCVASARGGSYDATWVGHEVRLDEWPCHQLALDTPRVVAIPSLDDRRLGETGRETMQRRGQRSCVVLPLIARAKAVGLIDLLDQVERTFSAEEIAIAEAVSQLVALALEHAQLFKELKNVHVGNLRALSSALSAKDYYTLGHASRVAVYMTLLGRELGWPEERLDEVQNAAFLHDIGKIAISERVLLKAGPLTDEEWQLMRQHPVISAEIVRPIVDDELIAGVRHHHERFDGGGYPDGLAGEAIPTIARALCVVDSYDAMSCRRSYQRALTYQQCLAELKRCAGRQFDPQMVTAFLAALPRLQRRRTALAKIAQEAATLIDPASHARLRRRSDEHRHEYAQMVGALRRLRTDNPPVRFITSFAVIDEQCITVLDTGETENELSHIGEPWLPEDELARLLGGESQRGNVLNADDFGVWVSGLAALRDSEGAVVGAVSVDEPAVESLDWSLQGERSHALAAMLQAASIRFSRAEVDAITDSLTGLYNHRYLHERLEEEIERARRREGTFSLLFYDCDQFKIYNDTYGHKAGDVALERIARLSQACSRRVDLAARYGGEEFVLVLVDTNAAGALIVAERLRAEIAAASAASGRPLTISIGAATFPADGNARDELLDKADWAMYAAKRAGGNRVLAFSDDLGRSLTQPSRLGR